MDFAPRSDPVKDPTTVAVPPGLGKVNPALPDGLETMLYSEKWTRLGRMATGVQSMVRASDRRVSTPLHALVGLWTVTVVVPPVTADADEPRWSTRRP